MKIIDKKSVLLRDQLTVYDYSLNIKAIKMFELGAFFLLAIAALVYPITGFDPPLWAVAPIVLGILATAVFSFTQYWRAFAKKAFVAYDKDELFITTGGNRAMCIAWKDLDIDNSGLSNPESGGILLMKLGTKTIKLRLFSAFVCIPRFEEVLKVMLQNIKKNHEAKEAKQAK